MADALDGFTERTSPTTADHATVFCRGHRSRGDRDPRDARASRRAVADFARRVVDAGFSVRMPSLFGEPGQADERRLRGAVR